MAMQGTLFNLTCPVNMTSGPQGSGNSSWVMLKAGNPIPVNSKDVMSGTSLAIQSADYTDSGWYRCYHTLGQTQRCFDINLQVQGKILNIVPDSTNSSLPFLFPLSSGK